MTQPPRRHPRHIKIRPDGPAWPERYFSGLSKTMKLIREKELLKRRTTPYAQLRLGTSNQKGTKKKSKWTQKFHQVYPNLKFNKNLISKRTGIPREKLDIVYNRGLKAWKTGGSRVGATAAQWAVARVYKFVLVSKKKVPRNWYESKFDPDNNLRHKGNNP